LKNKEEAKMDDKLLLHGSQILQTLINRSKDFWGYLPGNPDHVYKISRAGSQLIEAIYWLGCQEDVFPLLEDLIDYMTQKSFLHPEHQVYHISRLKSILQYIGSDTSGAVDNEALIKSIEHFTFQEYDLPNTTDYLRLSASDLFAFILYSIKTNPIFVDKIPLDIPLQQSIEAKFKSLNRYILKIMKMEHPEKDPRIFSYAIWQKFGFHALPDNSKSKRPKSPTEEDINRLLEATKKYDEVHRSRSVKDIHVILQVIYPKLTLSWINQIYKTNYDLSGFFEWLSPQIDILQSQNDPYALGLALKAIIAANPSAIRAGFRKQILSQAIHSQVNESQEQDSRDNLERIIRGSVKVDLDKELDRLTGGWSAARVWSVRGNFSLPLRKDGTSNVESAGAFNYIIKTGPKGDFTKAATLYSALGEQGQKLFPVHDQDASLFMTKDGPLFYLIMQELIGYKPIGKAIQDLLPKDPTMATPNKKIIDWVQAGFSAIEQLHQIKPVNSNPFSNRPSAYLKVAEMFEWSDISAKRNFQRKSMSASGIYFKDDTGTERYIPSMQEMLPKIMNRIGRIQTKEKPEMTRETLVHGDSHGYNIMAKEEDIKIVKFIDIGSIGFDDYLNDYADYVTHICLTMDMENRQDEDYVIKIISEKSEKGKLYIEMSGLEPPFPVVLSKVFLKCLENIKDIGKKRKDQEIELRFLWLLARRLLFVSSKTDKSPNKSQALFMQAAVIIYELLERLETPHIKISNQVPYTKIYI
jgi:aminoglycoside phosphotransferase